LGIDHLNLPLLGPIGVVDGRLQIPLIGSYALANWELLDDYRDNFLAGGSWHLLWSGLVIATVLLLRYRQWQLVGKIGAGLFSLGLAMLFIFQFTENGAWAEDWSAINRLPLHFAPFLALVLAVAVEQLYRLSSPARMPIAIGIYGVAALTLALSFLLFTSNASRDEDGVENVISANTLTAVIGKVAPGPDESLVYDTFQDGIAVVTSGPVTFAADAASLITVSSGGDNQEAFNFFWRNDQAPGELHSVFVDTRGDFSVDLGDDARWNGRILEIGITAFDDGRSLTLQSVTIAPNNAAAQRKKALADWLAPNSWSQRSVNWIDAGSSTAVLSLPLVLALGVLVAAGVVIVLRGDWSRSGLGAGLAIAVLAWLLLDARWLASRLSMSVASTTTYPLVQAKAFDFGGDARVYQQARRVHELLIDPERLDDPGDSRPQIVLVSSERAADLFQRLRGRYHLLPLAALDIESPERAMATPAQQALILKSAFRQPGAEDLVANTWLTSLGADAWSIRYDAKGSALLSAK
jgi:hypothetical protein